jgi:MFS transporter, SP family, major inositol transporter
MRRILWIGCGLATVQQATGIKTVNYYAPTILESTGLGASASLILTITVGIVGIIATVLIGRVNRRPLLLTGSPGSPPVTQCWRCRSSCRNRDSRAT